MASRLSGKISSVFYLGLKIYGLITVLSNGIVGDEKNHTEGIFVLEGT